MSKSIIIDVDGVVADFTLGFTRWANENISNTIPVIPSRFHQRWSFDQIMLPHQVNRTWEHINDHPEWWGELSPLVGGNIPERLNEINKVVPIYYVTNRPQDATRVTNEWLVGLGIHYPNVITSKRKGEVARLLGATHAIDDKIENAQCIHWISDNPQTRVYLLDRPYNRDNADHPISHRILRVHEFVEFLDDLELVY